MQRCTTPTLARMLNQILMHHIRDCLPDIKNRITSMMIEVNQDPGKGNKTGTGGKSTEAGD